MSTHLRLPALAFACLSVVLNIAILACAARTLHLFHDQQSTNAWFLPIWPNHFDLRGLQTLIGTSVATLVLNAVAVVALLVPSVGSIFPDIRLKKQRLTREIGTSSQQP